MSIITRYSEMILLLVLLLVGLPRDAEGQSIEFQPCKQGFSSMIETHLKSQQSTPDFKQTAASQEKIDYFQAVQSDCAFISVPLDWNNPPSPSKNPEIKVKVERLRLTSDIKNIKRRIVVLPGGPGSDVTGGYGQAKSYVMMMMQQRVEDWEIYVAEHRGAGQSKNGLDCPNAKSVDDYDICYAKLAVNFDITQFSITNAAYDLNWLISKLKTPNVKTLLHGHSYGTAWARRYLQLFPYDVDGVILEGIVCHQLPCKPPYAERAADSAATKIYKDCASNPFCGQKFPDLQTWNSFIATFDNPIEQCQNEILSMLDEVKNGDSASTKSKSSDVPPPKQAKETNARSVLENLLKFASKIVEDDENALKDDLPKPIKQTETPKPSSTNTQLSRGMLELYRACIMVGENAIITYTRAIYDFNTCATSSRPTSEIANDFKQLANLMSLLVDSISKTINPVLNRNIFANELLKPLPSLAQISQVNKELNMFQMTPEKMLPYQRILKFSNYRSEFTEAEVKTPAPVLGLNGYLDGQTPLEQAEIVMKQVRSESWTYLIGIPKGGHSVSNVKCLQETLYSFIAEPKNPITSNPCGQGENGLIDWQNKWNVKSVLPQ